MRIVKTRGLPDGSHGDRTYVFDIHDEGSPLRVEIPGDTRGPDLAIPQRPEQEAWMRTCEGSGCRAYWDCQWAFSDAEALARFEGMLAERMVASPPPPAPRAYEPPPEPSWAERLARLEAPAPPPIPDWSVAESWARIDDWYARNLPALGADLRPPASARDIARLEKALGRRLAKELRQSLACHDGQSTPLHAGPGVIGNWELLSVDRILQHHATWGEHLAANELTGPGYRAKPGRGVRRLWWSPAWLPVTYDGAGGHHCVDHDPGKGGAVGQLLLVRPGEPERRVRASGVRAWLAGIAQALESGRAQVQQTAGTWTFYGEGFLF